MRSITQPNRDQGGTATRLGGEAVGRVDLRLGSVGWGLLIAAACLVVYVAVNPDRLNFYEHFVWQAQAWLDGRTSIPIGVPPSASSPGNDWYQDVMPILDAHGQETGRGLIPFPPLPALFLLPFVAIWHLRTNEQLLATVFGAIDVGLAYWMLGYLPIGRSVRALSAVFLGLGTSLLYCAAIGTTWFWAHIVAVGCLLLAIGLALSADRSASEPRATPALGRAIPRGWPGGIPSLVLIVAVDALAFAGLRLVAVGAPAAAVAAVVAVMVLLLAPLAVVVSGSRYVLAPAGLVLALGALFAAPLAHVPGPAVGAVVFTLAVAIALVARLAPRRLTPAAETLARAAALPETRQIAAGFLFGLAVAARLTVVFGLPFFVLVGGGGNWLKRGLLAAIGAAGPGLGLLLYTYASTGHLFNPAYDYLYQLELGYTFLNYHADWAITDVRYLPQNLGIFLLSLPRILPDTIGYAAAPVCTAGQSRGLFDQSCPLAVPDPVGMSILLTSPAYLLAPFAFLRSRVAGLDRAAVGSAIAVVAIEVVNLMHFSQGWVQFGYRFSLDFAPFALVLVALGAARLGRPRVLAALVVAAIAVNLWGTIWGVVLGW